jgi:simple sugar transport system ATP-binding protein
MNAVPLETYGLTKRFGAFTALDGVSLNVRPGTVHALLGENGAGKSTLVKCIVGYYLPDDGAVLVDGREQAIASPTVARDLGIGMVYQHFTVVPGMTVAENLLLARGHLPAVLPWKRLRPELAAFMASAPFQLDLDATPLDLSAGEKQKLEILKQLFLKPRLLILDEPTSVLTPQEADEVLGALRQRAHAGNCSVLMITHKFREVAAYADDVTVLRRGRLVHTGQVADSPQALLAQAMVGGAEAAPEVLAEAVADTEADAGAALDSPAGSAEPDGPVEHAAPGGAPVSAAAQTGAPGDVQLAIQGLQVLGDRGEPAVQSLSLEVRSGEIVGVAGVSGNGQRELMEALVGQRRREAGSVRVAGQPYAARRAENRRLRVRALPEEPLRNACVAELSVAQNMALRNYDAAPFARFGWVRWGALRERARAWIAEYGIKTQGERAAIRSLSGGNVQRAVLARELADDARLLLVANPVFGLDFAAVAEIHGRLRAARQRGCAVLLISEDLDELLALADRIVVLSEGRIVYDVPAAQANRHDLGAHMGGKGH